MAQNSPQDPRANVADISSESAPSFPSVGGGSAYVAREQQLIAKLQTIFGAKILSAGVELGDAVIRIAPGDLLAVCKELRGGHPGLKFDMLLSITAIDWLDRREDRFEVVYHFLSLEHQHRLRLVCAVAETAPEIASLTSLWLAADFLERECWDMYGIVFKGHPDLRRILMYDEFQGFPLRKDYPVQGKQPRIPLRSPEVRNTAVDMHRSSLVAINPRGGKRREGGDVAVSTHSSSQRV